ncbi:hypothetical protein AB0D65_31870 [Streptomyces griseoloalbus]|uniref:Uncharacterized protein n=1 Tax=Streptomyces griseoloalbus TaxID=67303 RepID=A0ABV3EE94_9ACTN
MTVNEAVLALLRPKPDLAQFASEPADVFAAAQAAVDAPAGLGAIVSYATEPFAACRTRRHTASRRAARARARRGSRHLTTTAGLRSGRY